MAIDLHTYLELYLKTAFDLLDVTRSRVTNIKNSSKDVPGLKEVHRAVHSLKSQSLIMGFRQIGLASQALEKLFSQAQDHPEMLTEKLLEEISQLLDKISQSLNEIQKNKGELDLSHFTKKISRHFIHTTT